MNKKGFTLVELMVVIVIIGILAAYIGPNYTEGTRKAKLSEFIPMLGRITMKEHQFYAESRTYREISQANWRNELRTNFEMFLDVQFFEYYVDSVSDTTFRVVAELQEDMGRAQAGAKATVNQNGDRAFVDDTDGGLESYTGDWLDLRD